MIKDIQRECANRAFRKYALTGLSKLRLPPFDMYRIIKRAGITKKNAYSLLAVYDMLRILACTGRNDAAKAVAAVYFASKKPYLSKNEVTMRVRRFADENHLDERTVYRKLDEARKLYVFLASGEYKT